MPGTPMASRCSRLPRPRIAHASSSSVGREKRLANWSPMTDLTRSMMPLLPTRRHTKDVAARLYMTRGALPRRTSYLSLVLFQLRGWQHTKSRIGTSGSPKHPLGCAPNTARIPLRAARCALFRGGHRAAPLNHASVPAVGINQHLDPSSPTKIVGDVKPQIHQPGAPGGSSQFRGMPVICCPPRGRVRLDDVAGKCGTHSAFAMCMIPAAKAAPGLHRRRSFPGAPNRGLTDPELASDRPIRLVRVRSDGFCGSPPGARLLNQENALAVWVDVPKGRHMAVEIVRDLNPQR
jgi:hypothetical protein